MRTFCLYLSMSVLFSLPTVAQSFASFIENIQTVPAAQREEAVQAFLQDHPVFPITESDSIAIFLYTGPATSVSIAGDMNGWNPDVDQMTAIAGTELWYLIKPLHEDARLDYKIVIDGSSWILDPRNERIARGGFGDNSELRMPAYEDPTELTLNETIPHGSVYDTTFFSAELGNERRVSIYVPADLEKQDDSLGIVVVHDGLEFLSLGGMTGILDNLIADHRIPPILVICIPPVDRTREYAGDRMGTFSLFIVDEIVRTLRSSYPISSDPARHTVMGASNGGNISLYMGMTYPNLFGNIAAFSSNVVPMIMERFSFGDRIPVRVYLDIGTYDIPQLIPLVRGLHRILQTRGYDVHYAEHHDGHSWANWRSHIDDALTFLLSDAERP